MIDSRQLRYFIALARVLHFGRAADVLGVAQSALSTQIKRLEDDFGVRLLNRQKRAQVSLTDAGALFLIEAEAALRQLERADRAGRMAGRGELGQIEIAYVASAAVSGVLSNALAAFRTDYPLVEVRVLAMDTPGQIRTIADGSIDVGFIRPRQKYATGVTAHVVHRDQLMIAVPISNPLAARETIHAADLAQEKFIVPQFDETAGFRENLERLSAAGGFALTTGHRVADFVTALGMAAGGYGVSLIPQAFERLLLDGLVMKPIVDFHETIELVLAWRRNAGSPAAHAFVATTLKTFAVPKG